MLFSPVKIDQLIPLHDHIIVADMSFGERKSRGGIVLRDDNMKTEGVRPRWGQVYAIGPDQTDIKVGDWILVEHGRWTRGAKIINSAGQELLIMRVDNKAIIAQSAEKPQDDTIGEASIA